MRFRHRSRKRPAEAEGRLLEVREFEGMEMLSYSAPAEQWACSGLVRTSGPTISASKKATVAYPTIKRLFDPHILRYEASKAFERPCDAVVKRAPKRRVCGFHNLR